MPEVKIDPKNWEAACEWAEANAQRLGLYFLGAIAKRQIALSKRTQKWGLSLAFQLAGLQLEKIQFTVGQANSGHIAVSWYGGIPERPNVPETLLKLIETEKSYQGSNLENPQWIKEAVHRFPAFSKAYDEVYRRLFPPYEHHELHTDIGEYEEAILEDEELLKRLGEK